MIIQYKKSEKVEIITRKKVEKQGRKDGKDFKRYLPLWFLIEKDPQRVTPHTTSTTCSSYETNLRTWAKNKLKNLYDNYLKEDLELRSQYIQKESDEQKLNMEKVKIKQNSDQRDAEMKSLTQKIEDVQEDITAKEGEKNLLDTEIGKYKRSLGGIIALIGILTGEAFFNAVAFDVLRQNRIETWVMALAIILAIPWASCNIGNSIKNDTEHRKGKLLALAQAIFVFLSILGIGIIRKEMLEGLIKEGTNISMSSGVAGLIFIIFNLLLLVLFITIEYKNAPSDPKKYKQDKADRDLCKIKIAEYKATCNRYEEEKNEKEKELREIDIDSKLIQITAEKYKIMEKRIVLCRTYQSEVSQEAASWYGFIKIYREENRKARKYTEVPLNFENIGLIDTTEVGILATIMHDDNEIKTKLNYNH